MNRELLRAWLTPLVLIVLSAVVGAALVVASSPGSLARPIKHGDRGIAPLPEPSPSPAASVDQAPSPASQLGVLKVPVTLRLLGGRLYVADSAKSFSSTDGVAWDQFPAAPGGASAIPDPGRPNRLIGGGQSMQISADGGKTWQRPVATPPPGPPYLPLLVSPTDSSVWFVLHQGKLARTRDDGASWRDISGLPALSGTPVLAAGAAAGQFFIGVGGKIVELIDNGQQVQDRGALPNGATVADLAQAGAGSPGILAARGSDGVVYLLKNGVWGASPAPTAGPLAAATGKSLLVSDGTGKLGDPGMVAYSGDLGASWASATGLPGDQSVDVAALDGDGASAYAYCAGGDIYKSSDGGKTWSFLSSTLRTA